MNWILTIDFEINLKIFLKKILWICSYTYRMMVYLNFIQFYYRLVVHQRPLNYNRCKLYKILTDLDGVSNDNEIAWNLKHHQPINIRTYP
jgi:hypothetical protein